MERNLIFSITTGIYYAAFFYLLDFKFVGKKEFGKEFLIYENKTLLY